MRTLFILLLSVCTFKSFTQNIAIVEDGNQIGIVIENVDEVPDSVVLFWQCDPLQGRKNLYHQQIYIGDTLWFTANHYFKGFAIFCYKSDNFYWPSQFSNWQAHSWFESTDFVEYVPSVIPVIKLLDIPGFGNQQNLRLISNGYKTRVTIFRNYSVVYQQNFNGTEGIEIQHSIQTILQTGSYMMVITGCYTDVLLCQHNMVLRFPFNVVN